MWRFVLCSSLPAAVAFAACTFPEVSFETPPVTPPLCVSNADCTQPAELCHQTSCIDGSRCEDTLLAAGSPCGNDLSCDELGDCVECSGPGDCGSDTCQDGHCVPSHCTNMAIDPNESDEDCGGECNGCIDGKICNVAADCLSGFCNDGAGGAAQCGPCTSDTDCSLGTFCSSMTDACMDKLAPGVSCTRANECQSGFCPDKDFICCDLACNGKCEACLYVKTGAPQGECNPITAGTDPDNECLVTNCSGAQMCL